MDLSFTQDVDTYELTITDPLDQGKPTDVVITMLSPNSAEYRKIQRECKIEDGDERTVFLMAKATKSWVNMEFNGKLECNYKNVKFVYGNSTEVLTQVFTAFLDRVNFMKGKG